MIHSAQASIEEAIKRGEWSRASAEIRQVFEQSPNPALAQWVLAQKQKFIDQPPLRQCRLAVLRSFTFEPLVAMLQAQAFFYGIDLQVQLSDFNAYAQEILNPASRLYAFEPGIVALSVQTRDLLPDVWSPGGEMTTLDRRRKIDAALNDIRDWITVFRSRSSAYLILQGFEIPRTPHDRGLGAQPGEDGREESMRRFNLELVKIAGLQKGVCVLDYDALVSRFGHEHWTDEQKWLAMRMPISADCLVHMAKEYLRFIVPMTGKLCKVLVTDLDNTLWGGVVGEDGMQGILIGPNPEGAAYLEVQKVLLDFKRRGIALAVSSKNNSADALEVLENHSAMLLRPKDFAALRINWNDKAENIREIARELNIGLEDMAFLDDNPAERELVRSRLPEISVIELPKDPAAYAGILRECPIFERISLSQEDQDRGRYYAEDRERRELKKSCGSLEDFYHSLEMEAEIRAASQETLPRVAQLTQRTNQFNLTTCRLSEQEIAEFFKNPRCSIYCLSARDRFGDNGIVGAAILFYEEERRDMHIHTFLLSCRVIGRTLETAFLAALAREAVNRGALTLSGWFAPTKKNMSAADFYARHHFGMEEEKEGNQLWKIDLVRNRITCPRWIKCFFSDQELV